MAVQAPDKEERENPVRNFVAGTTGEEKVKYVKAVDPDGKTHKLRAENQSDWLARGNGHKIQGAWIDPKADAEEEAEYEDEVEDEDDDTAANTDGASSAAANDDALKELIALREKAASLGVSVNEQWGKKRLGKEIAAAEFRAKQSS